MRGSGILYSLRNLIPFIGILSIISIFKSRFIPIRPIIYIGLFCFSFIPGNVFGQYYDFGYVISQYLSLTVRLLCGLAIIAAIRDSNKLLKLIMSISIPIIILYLIWSIKGSASWYFGLRINLENIGASAILAILPFCLILGKRTLYSFGLLFVGVLFTLDARVALMIAIANIALYLLFRIRMKKIAVFGSVVFGVFSPVLIYTLFSDVMLPTSVPEADSDVEDRVRMAINGVALLAFAEYPITGIGLGSFNAFMETIYGYAKLPHGVVPYVLAQGGLIGLGVFMFLTYKSVSLPLRIFLTSKSSFYFCLMLCNVNGFVYFITRPQQDNFIYFTLLIAGWSSQFLFKNDNKSF